MSPRKSRSAGQSRQQIACRLRERRTHEELLIVAAADALARRNAAESAVAEAMDALNASLEELQRHGFELTQVAELLDVDAAELTRTGSSRRVTGKSSRGDGGSEPPVLDEIAVVNFAG